MIAIERKKLEQVLDDLICASSYCNTYDAIDVVKEALAQPEQEPVAWTPGPNLFKDWCSQYFGPDSDDDYLAKAVFNLPPMAQRFANTTPQKRQPLTVVEIMREWASAKDSVVEFARVIEAAHGIKENT